ncbi:MAG: type II secretion system protein [Kiritimatiellae bacterium]|nr:type II secretion system protein [Kiritimatiellia bacterium]
MKCIRFQLNAGFTLVEMLLVVAILAVLASFASVRFSRSIRSARLVAAETDIHTIRDAFLSKSGGYLRDMEGIPGFSAANLRIANLLIATNLYGNTILSPALTRAVRVDESRQEGCAPPEAFTAWDETKQRGWHGPYLQFDAGTSVTPGVFPAPTGRRTDSDATFSERGFFPDLANLRLPADFRNRLHDCSIYGFPGEPAVMDPWGNPYVLQIPPPQAFPGSSTNIPDHVRFRFARIVSAGPDGILQTPCFTANATNWLFTSWNRDMRRLSRQAGLIDGDNRSARGDDLVLFLTRNDIDEGDDE